MTNREIQHAIELARIKETNPRKTRVDVYSLSFSKASLDTLLHGLNLYEAQAILASEFDRIAKNFMTVSLDASICTPDKIRIQKNHRGYGAYLALFDEESDTEWEARCEVILRAEKQKKEAAARRMAREKASLKKEIQALQERLDSLG